MTMFIQIQNGLPVGYAVTEDNLKALFPDVTFPVIFTPQFVEPLGYGIYEWTQVPDVTYPNKRIEIAPTLRDNGIYYQTWGIVEMTQEEKTEATSTQANNVRAMRNMLLLHSDWTQGADTPLTKERVSAWATYRQALRDITAQPGFPWDVQWPSQPT